MLMLGIAVRSTPKKRESSLGEGPWGLFLAGFPARFAGPGNGMRAGCLRAQAHGLDRLGQSSTGFQLAGVFQQLLITFLDLVLSLLPIFPGHF